MSAVAETQGRELELGIRRTSTAEQVADVLREAIMRGDFKPGASLRESALATSLGISRNSFREALRLLAAEGLVTHHLHRGVIVSRLTEADVQGICATRVVLEVAAVDSAREVSRDRLAPVGDAVRRLGESAAAQDWVSILEHDLGFHRGLVGLLASRRIDEFYAALQRELRLGLSIVDHLYPDLASVSEHAEMYDLLVRGEYDACKALVRRHIAGTERQLRQTLGEMAMQRDTGR